MTPPHAIALLGLDVRTLLVVAGVGQLLLVAASLAIPRVLGWPAELKALSPFTRQVFWTYAAYVAGTHAAFGLVSLLATDALLDGSPLARLACAFIAAWWTARVVVSVVRCEAHALPGRPAIRLAHGTLLATFASLAAGYAFLALRGAG